MGLLDDIGGVLSNPELQMLAPMVLGGAGGYLSAPPMSGVGGRIGRGMLGMATGYEKGQELTQKTKMDAAQLGEIQQHTANMKLEATKAQNALDDDTKFNQWVDTVIPGMPENDVKQLRAMVASGDKQGAVQFWANSNQQTRDMDGKIISGVFGGDAKTISELPLSYRQQYRAAAISAQTSGGDIVQSPDGVYLVNKRTGQSQQLKNPDGSPMRPMQPLLKEMMLAGQLERSQEAIAQRTQAEQDRIRMGKYNSYLRNQDSLQRTNAEKQRNYDYGVSRMGWDPSDPDDEQKILKAFGPRPADLPLPMSEDEFEASTSGAAPPGSPAPVTTPGSGTSGTAPAAPSGTPAAAGPPGSPPGSPAGAKPELKPGTTPPRTTPAAAPTSAASPKPPTTPKEPGTSAANPPKKVMDTLKAEKITPVGPSPNGKSLIIRLPNGKEKLLSPSDWPKLGG